MKKKWIITISSLLVLVGLVLLLAFTLFSLKKVTIDFRTSTSYITQSKEEIIESAKFNMGKTVLIHNRKQYKKRIEELNPYIKVINIETVFPSQFVVHISERQEVFAIPFEYGHYICDEELRVLKIAYTYSPKTENAILLTQEGVEVENDIVEGEYITSMRLPNIYKALYASNRTLADQKEMIESITLKTEYDVDLKQDVNATVLKFYSGQTFKIFNDDYGLKHKASLVNKVYGNLFTFIGKVQEEGQQPFTEEDLKDCTIIIDNFYEKAKYGESECYFKIIVNN